MFRICLAGLLRGIIIFNQIFSAASRPTGTTSIHMTTYVTAMCSDVLME